MPITNEARDKFIVPGMSAFTAAVIPDLSEVSPEQGSWVGNFLLNSMFRGRFEGPFNAALMNFLRRTHAGFEEYSQARSSTLAYLENPDAVMRYLTAITHWEGFLSQSYQAYCLLSLGQKKMFNGQDGSVLSRLNMLYNRSKHIEKAVATAGQLPENGTLAVWLTNDGLRSTDSHLMFSEIAEILRELARYADAIQDPATMREKLTAIAADAAGGAD